MSSTNRIICKTLIEKHILKRNRFRIGDLCAMCVVREKLSCKNLKRYLAEEAKETQNERGER